MMIPEHPIGPRTSNAMLLCAKSRFFVVFHHHDPAYYTWHHLPFWRKCPLVMLSAQPVAIPRQSTYGTYRSVLGHMIAMIAAKFEILRGVVKSILIGVMRHLFPSQMPTEFFFKHKPVLCDISGFCRHGMISLFDIFVSVRNLTALKMRIIFRFFSQKCVPAAKAPSLIRVSGFQHNPAANTLASHG